MVLMLTPDGGSSDYLGNLSQRYSVPLGSPRSGGTSAAPEDPPVFLRAREKYLAGGHPYVVPPRVRQVKTAPASGLMKRFDKMSSNRKRNLAEKLFYATSDMTRQEAAQAAMSEPLDSVRALYQQLVEEAAERYAGGAGEEVSPEAILNRAMKYKRTAPIPVEQTARGWTVNPDTNVSARRSRLLAQFDDMGRDEIRIMAAKLIFGLTDATPEEVGELVAVQSLSTIRGLYESLLEEAENRFASGQKISPEDILDKAIDYKLGQDDIEWSGNDKQLMKLLGATAEDVPEDGDRRSYTTKSKTTNLMDPEDAQGLTRAMLQQELGRDPTKEEYEDFLSMLHAAQRKSPDRATTKSNQVFDEELGGWRSAGSTTTVRQGISSTGLQQRAYETATKQPDWAEWQAMGTYAPALMQALGATVPGT